MNSDQTAPRSSLILIWAHIVYNRGHQSTSAEESADDNCCEQQETAADGKFCDIFFNILENKA